MSNNEILIQDLITKTYPENINSGNASGYGEMYKNNCFWSPPGGPDQTTKEGVVKAISGLLSKSCLDVKIETDEIELHGDSAWVLGTVYGISEDRESKNKAKFKFKVIWILKKSKGVWKISRQVWNNKPV